MRGILVLFFITILLGLVSSQRRTLSSQRRSEQEIINTILNTDYYDSRINPGNDTRDGPVHIHVDIYVRDVEKLDDSKGEIKLQITLRQRWIDSRLSYPQSNPENLKYVTVHDISKIWTPDLFVGNERHAKLHEYSRHNSFARIYPNGEVLNSQRVSLTVYCHMAFKHYPFDTQNCPIRLTSYSHTSQDIVFDWQDKNPVQLHPDLDLPKFSFDDVITSKCETTTKTGTYSCVKANFVFHRRINYYLVQVFIPSLMLIILGWLAFWVDPLAIVARLILGATTLSLMVIHCFKLNESMPQVSYIKAIDTWTGICMTFLFFALGESIVVNYWARSEASKGPSRTTTASSAAAAATTTPSLNGGGGTDEKSGEGGGGEKEPKEETNLIEDPEAQTKEGAAAAAAAGDEEEGSGEGEGGKKKKKKSKGGNKKRTVDAKKYVKKYWADLETHSKKLDFTVRILYPVLFLFFVVVFFAVCCSGASRPPTVE